MTPALGALTLAAMLASVACFSDHAAARQATAPGRFVASTVDQQITVRDTSRGVDVVSPSNHVLATNTGCAVQTTLTPKDNGLDIRLTFTNNGTQPAHAGGVDIGSFRLGAVGWALDLRSDARRFTLDTRPSGSVQAPEKVYPTTTYSPVTVFGGEHVTVGVALLYPILEYKHEAFLNLRARPGPDGSDWEMSFWICGNVDPGQSRHYTVTIRFAAPNDAWVRTLVPYRDFFRATYGAVRYTRDPRPVSGLTVSMPEALSASNPWGFNGGPDWRPDLYGWAKWAAYIRQRPTKNYKRVMLWKISGVYADPAATFPFRFATRMNDFPAMQSSLQELHAIHLTGLDTGYWWGTSCSIDFGWSPEGHEPLDINNPDHVARGFAELDMAVNQLGATTIGLDAFLHGMKAWDAHAWLLRMQERAPGVKFVTELSLPDIFHVFAPTYVFSNEVATEKVLADFLVPGHETWVGVGFHVLAQQLGRPLTNVDKRAEIARLIRLGYVPVIFDDYDISGHNFSAQPSWLTTVPEDLREEAPALPALGPESGTGGGAGAPPPQNPENPSVATHTPDRPANGAGVSGAGASGWDGAGFTREQVLEALRRARP